MSSEENDHEQTAGTGSSEGTASRFRFPGSTSAGSRARKPRKQQFRWNYFKDQVLITEVERLEVNNDVGSAANSKWQEIAEIVSAQFSGSVSQQGAKDRFFRLVASHKMEDFRTRYKSGTEEEVTALTEKLSNIASKLDDRKVEEKEAKSKKVNEEKAAGDIIRKAATTTTPKRKYSDGTEEAPPTKRASEKSLLDLWKVKQEQDRLVERQRLETEMEQRDKDREIR